MATIDPTKLTWQAGAPMSQDNFDQPVQTKTVSPAPTTTAPTGGATTSVQDQLASAKTQLLGIQDALNKRTQTAEPTVGETLGSLTFEKGPTYQELYPDIDEDKVRRSQLKMFQGQIDATNQIYDQMLNEARLEGQGRLGSQRAMAARGGLLGSDFGASQKQKVQDFNTDVNRSIQAERSARIGEIMGQVRSAVTAELAEKRAARQQGAENYLNYLKNESSRRQNNLTLAANALLAQGIDPTTLDENELGAIAQEAGLKPQDIITQYRQLVSQQVSGDQFTLSKGENRYDAAGNLIASGPEDGGKWTVYSTSSGLVRVNADTGETQKLTSGGGTSGSGSSSGVSFTSSEKKKLEQAGLLDSSRQRQLDYLYGDDATDELTLDAARQWATANMSRGKESIRNELIAGGLSATLADGVLSEIGFGKDSNVLTESQFSSNITKIASSIRKAAASLSKSPEEELAVARAQAEKGVLKISGKEYVLTPEQKQQLLAEIDTIGPRSLLEQILPGGG